MRHTAYYKETFRYCQEVISSTFKDLVSVEGFSGSIKIENRGLEVIVGSLSGCE